MYASAASERQRAVAEIGGGGAAVEWRLRRDAGKQDKITFRPFWTDAKGIENFSFFTLGRLAVYSFLTDPYCIHASVRSTPTARTPTARTLAAV